MVGTRKVREARLQESRHAHADADPRPGGGARPRTPEDPDHRPVRRHRGGLHRLRDDLLLQRDRLSDQRRRPAAALARRPTSRSPSSWPCLLAGGSSFFGFFTLAGLPQPYHPVFESEDFARAAVDAYFLSVELPPEGEAEKVFAEVHDRGRSVGRAGDGVRAMRIRDSRHRRPDAAAAAGAVARAGPGGRRLRREHPRSDGRSRSPSRSATKRATSTPTACRCAPPPRGRCRASGSP